MPTEKKVWACIPTIAWEAQISVFETVMQNFASLASLQAQALGFGTALIWVVRGCACLQPCNTTPRARMLRSSLDFTLLCAAPVRAGVLAGEPHPFALPLPPLPPFTLKSLHPGRGGEAIALFVLLLALAILDRCPASNPAFELYELAFSLATLHRVHACPAHPFATLCWALPLSVQAFSKAGLFREFLILRAGLKTCEIW
jgi:hypothetical protein